MFVAGKCHNAKIWLMFFDVDSKNSDGLVKLLDLIAKYGDQPLFLLHQQWVLCKTFARYYEIYPDKTTSNFHKTAIFYC